MTVLLIIFAVCLLSTVTLGMMALGSRARLLRDREQARQLCEYDRDALAAGRPLQR